MFSTAECYFLDTNSTRSENSTDATSPACEGFVSSIQSLGNGTFLREDFLAFFDEFLLVGVQDFILQGVPEGYNTSSIDIAAAANGLLGYIFDGQALVEEDFASLFDFAASNDLDVRRLGQKLDKDLFEVDTSLRRLSSDFELLQMKERALLTTDDLSPECIEVIIRIVVELIALILAGLGIRARVLKPVEEVFLVLKGPQLSGLVLQGWRKSRGKFDLSFFAGLVAGFLSALTWEDLKTVLQSLDKEAWVSIAVGIMLAVAGTLATGGLALALLVGGIILQAASLKSDIEGLGQCFALCDDGFTQSGGQQTTTYAVGLDRSKGTLSLTYQMYSVPDRLDLIYEGTTIFTTGGLVSGTRTISATIDGNAKVIYVRIEAPNSGTAWNFQLTCPVPEIDILI